MRNKLRQFNPFTTAAKTDCERIENFVKTILDFFACHVHTSRHRRRTKLIDLHDCPYLIQFQTGKNHFGRQQLPRAISTSRFATDGATILAARAGHRDFYCKEKRKIMLV